MLNKPANRNILEEIKNPPSRPGNHKTLCPDCSHTRKHANQDDPCLSVTINTDGQVLYNCHNCNMSGTWYLNGIQPRMGRENISYTIPKVVAENLPQMAVRFFTDRGIGKEVRDLYKIGYKPSHYFNPSMTDDPAIIFPYFKNGQLVNAKYRGKDKTFTQEKNAEKVLFGMDLVPADAKTLIIVEGEMDVLSFAQAGIMNVVSVPDGAPAKLSPDTTADASPTADALRSPEEDKKYSYLWNCQEFLSRFDKFILATDGDIPGQNLKEELARRLDKIKCCTVQWPDNSKDANELLLNDIKELTILIESAKPYPINDYHQYSDILKDIERIKVTGLSQGLPTGWTSLDNNMRLEKGRVMVVTGWPGHGKSEFIETLVFNQTMLHQWKVALCSIETDPAELGAQLMQKFAKEPFFGEGKMGVYKFGPAAEHLCKHFSSIYPTENSSMTIEWVLEKARIGVIRDGIDCLVIDNYTCFEKDVTKYKSETNYVSELMGKMTRFAKEHDVLVIMIAHPAKIPDKRKSDNGELPVPGPMDISGSQNWWNKADYCVSVHRPPQANGTLGNDTDIHIKKVKKTRLGKPGIVPLVYDSYSGHYLED